MEIISGSDRGLQQWDREGSKRREPRAGIAYAIHNGLGQWYAFLQFWPTNRDEH